MHRVRMAAAAGVALVTAAVAWVASAQEGRPPGDWTSYGQDEGGSRFSALDQITPGNVAQLRPLWLFELKPADRPDARLVVSNHTPLAVDGTLYLATPYGRVVALDGDSGAERWSYSLPDDDAVAGRGMEYWSGDGRTGPRLFFGTRSGKLVALDPRTGQPAAGFRTIELRTPEVLNGLTDGGDPPSYSYQLNSAPARYRDVLITGARLQESPAQGPAGDIRGWDAVTGKLLWTFHTVPRAGERFADSWGGGSGRQRTGVNA
jgi:quinoprotein glucose dehydrogenase